MSTSKFGEYGGQYVPEALMPAVEELEDAYERYVLNNEDGFMDEFRRRLREFGGRPTPLQYAEQLSERYDSDVYLKREDLLHGGAAALSVLTEPEQFGGSPETLRRVRATTWRVCWRRPASGAFRSSWRSTPARNWSARSRPVPTWSA